ncbi:MAG TPA: AbrB/MazE/SpoVT family DNA-binding domain-containing protein [Candidatus Nanoarchaeia archaeon]|nr:AbrB/MazE/SpoVT family DNA-binding domain-containing protein [Candidatus Nanoarchaeia archaeon]
MAAVEFTRASSKGQVVIPQAIREKLGISEGTPFAVWSKGDEILLKKMEVPKQKSWDEVAAPFRAMAKERKISEEDILLAIQRVRAAKR